METIMAIELEVLSGKNLLTKKVEYFKRYKIMHRDSTGSRLVGYIDFDSDIVMFISDQFDEQFQKLVRHKVASILEKAEEDLQTSLPPAQPEEYINPTTDTGLITDEFDESDLT